jgi:hypothetical protein
VSKIQVSDKCTPNQAKNEKTEMMLVVMTDDCDVLGEFNTKHVFPFTLFLLHDILMPASRRHMK